jgi:hypothetical protein
VSDLKQENLSKNGMYIKYVEKVWRQDIFDDPDIGKIEESNDMWIYCQVCIWKVKMKYTFRGSRWNEHVKAVSHLDSRV